MKSGGKAWTDSHVIRAAADVMDSANTYSQYSTFYHLFQICYIDQKNQIRGRSNPNYYLDLKQNL